MKIKLFTWFWRKRLLRYVDAWEKYVPDTVVKVKGWRTALVDKPMGSRETITFCFWWLD